MQIILATRQRGAFNLYLNILAARQIKAYLN